MKTTTRTEGILPALETAHAVAALPKLLAGVGGVGGGWPADLLVLVGFSRSRRQGPRRAGTVRRRRTMAGRPMTTSVPPAVADTRTGTDATAGARREIHAAFARARADGRSALIPYVVAGYPDADASFEIALAAADAGADLLEVGLPYSDPLADGATLQRASGVALAAGATLERSLRLIERIGAARPDIPLVPMGYANQVIGGGAGEVVARRLAGAGAAGLIVADLTPDEGAPFETVARASGLAVVYLVAPTTPPARRAAIAARSGASVLRLPGRRDRRPDGAADDGRPTGSRGPCRLAGPGGGRVRRQSAGPRSCHRTGRGRWRHRGLRTR